MAVTITVADVREGMDTALPDSEIQLAITLTNGADKCFDANNVPDDMQRALKIYGARHICALQVNSGKGQVRSQTAPSGASQSFGGYSGKNGSPYYGLIDQLDTTGCMKAVIKKDGAPNTWLRAVG